MLLRGGRECKFRVRVEGWRMVAGTCERWVGQGILSLLRLGWALSELSLWKLCHLKGNGIR